MRQNSKQSLIILGIMIAALLVMALLYGHDFLQNRLLDQEQGYTFITDIDRWRKTRRERVVRSHYDFSLGPQLHELPLTIDEWVGQEVPQDNVEVQILLEPEQYVRRLYRNKNGDIVWLSIIGSRELKSFHPPQICYDADGWQTEIDSEEVPLQKGSIYAMHVNAQKKDYEHVILYFFLYPDYLRDSSRGIVLFKVTAPLKTSEEATLEIEKAFIRQFFYEASPHL